MKYLRLPPKYDQISKQHFWGQKSFERAKLTSLFGTQPWSRLALISIIFPLSLEFLNSANPAPGLWFTHTSRAHRKREINKSNKNITKCIHVWYFSRLIFDADNESEVFFLFYTNFYTPFLISHYLGLWVSPQTSVTDRIQAGGMRPPWKSVFLPAQSNEAVFRPCPGRVQAEFRLGLQ